MLVAVEAADRLVRMLADRGALSFEDAARELLALRGHAPAVAAEVLDGLLTEDPRLETDDRGICLAPSPWAAVPLADARYAVVDLETAGLGSRARIVEAAVVVQAPGAPPRELELLPGPDDDQLRAVRRLLDFAGDAVLCGHNLQFDLRFLDRELRACGVRVAAPLLDTLRLARRLLGERAERLGLDAVCDLLGTGARPEHRALPDARAAAELLTCLLGLAAELGARTVGDVLALSRARSPRKEPIRAVSDF